MEPYRHQIKRIPRNNSIKTLVGLQCLGFGAVQLIERPSAKARRAGMLARPAMWTSTARLVSEGNGGGRRRVASHAAECYKLFVSRF